MTLYCGFCFNAGFNGFDTHNTRGSNGKLTCKNLAETECRYCNEKGHTISRCDILKKTQRGRGRQNRGRQEAVGDGEWSQRGGVCQEVYVTSPVSTKIANSRNPFDALGDGELDIDVQVDEVKEPMDYDAVGTAKPMESTTDGMVIYGENGRKVTICWGKKFDYKWADEVDA